MTDVNDFLLSSGAPAFSFENVGDTVKGVIIASEVSQQRDFQTGKPKFYDDGNPMMQLVVTLATDLRDPERPDDDGHRRIFAPRTGKPQSMFQAIRTVVQRSGGRLEEGGTLAVKHVGTEASETRGFNPRKLYEAAYKPPTAGVNLDPEPTPAAAAPLSVEDF